MTPIRVSDTDVVSAKRALRTEMRRRRAGLEDRLERSAQIWASVLELCAQMASPGDEAVGAVAVPWSLRVMAFHGVGSEPETAALLELLEAGGHTALLPRVEGDHIVAVEHRRGDEFRPGAHGVPAPMGPAVDPATIDLVLVPGLAFTRDGRRLGQGGGYYDRFLPLLRPDCVVCGVGFEVQVVEDLPSEPHDRVLSMLITDAEPPASRAP